MNLSMKLRRTPSRRSPSARLADGLPRLRFEAPALVDTLHPGEDELVALKDVSEHPADIAASVQAALHEAG